MHFRDYSHNVHDDTAKNNNVPNIPHSPDVHEESSDSEITGLFFLVLLLTFSFPLGLLLPAFTLELDPISLFFFGILYPPRIAAESHLSPGMLLLLLGALSLSVFCFSMFSFVMMLLVLPGTDEVLLLLSEGLS